MTAQAPRGVRTLAPLGHVLVLSLLILPTLCLVPDERRYLLGALTLQLGLIAVHGVGVPLGLRHLRERAAGRMSLGGLGLGALLLPIGPLWFLAGLTVPVLRWRLGLEAGGPSESGLVAAAASGLLGIVALPFWRHELQARAEFE